MGCLFSCFYSPKYAELKIEPSSDIEFGEPGHPDEFYDEFNRPYSFSLQRRQSLEYGWD